MTELIEIRPGGKTPLADDVVAFLRAVGREDLVNAAPAPAAFPDPVPSVAPAAAPAATPVTEVPQPDPADEPQAVASAASIAIPVTAVADEIQATAANEPQVVAPEVVVPERQRRRLPTGKTITAAAFGVLLVGIQGVVQSESWRGLTDFARLIHIAGTEVQGVPLTLDGVSTTAALLALRAELSDESSTRERAAMYAFTFASAAANYWAGSVSGGTQGALYFGGMSLAVMFVFDMLLRQIRRAVRRNAGRRGRKMPQFGALQWVRYPRLTFRAGSLALAEGIEDPQEALDAARAEAESRAEAAKAAAEAAEVAAMDLPVLPIDADVLTRMSAGHRLAVAFGVLGTTDIPKAVALLRKHGAPVDSSHAYKIRPQVLEGAQS